MTPPKPLLLALAPVMFLCLWSMGYVVAKIGLKYAEPMTLLVLRYTAVVVIMAVLFLILRPPLPKTPADWGHVAFVGFLIQAIYFGMSYFAFRAGVAAGTVALIMSLQPIIVAIIAPRWSGEAISARMWIGLTLGLIGAGIVISARSSIAAPSIFGFLFCALGLAGITIGSLWEKRFGLSHHPVTANLIGFTAGLAFVTPLMLTTETMQVNWTWEFTAALAYLVIGNSVIAVGLLLAMIRAGDVGKVSALFYLVPPMAAVLAWFLLGEVMPPLAWAGMAVAAVGVWMATRVNAAK